MDQSFFQALHPRNFFSGTWESLDEERRGEKPSAHERRWPLLAYVLGAVVLTMMEYWGHGETYWKTLNYFRECVWAEDWLDPRSTWHDLGPHVWWSVWRFVGYFLIPALCVRFIFGVSLSDFGLKLPRSRQSRLLYLTLLALVLPVIAIFSFVPAFYQHYPFYKLAGRSWLDLLLWEGLYFLQFFSLEFFFRGFLLAAGRKTMGPYAIFAMLVPYCMIHYGKPMPEALAAIFAGLVLGTLAMKTKSIWGGLFLHVAVAFCMDFASLLQNRQIPLSWVPGN